MSSRKLPRRQPPIRGGRLRGNTGFEKRVQDAVERDAKRWGVSVPFYLSVMAADALGIQLDANARFERKPLKLVKTG